MNRRDVVISSLKLVGLGLLAPTLAKASEHLKFADDTDRSRTLVKSLEKATGKPYADITEDDLAKIEELTLIHIHVDSFTSSDFIGLENLKKLTFVFIFHSDPGILSKDVFTPLKSLETLTIKANQFDDNLSPDVFAGLTSVKNLDISTNMFEAFPESVFSSFPRLETIKITKNAFDSSTLKRLQDHFGDRLIA